MATLQLTHAPILNSNAQLLILPVNTAGVFLDPVLTRTKTLFPDNYQRYYRACRDGSLNVGSCMLHKRSREQAGLGISSNGNQPSHIANLVISNHPYHPARARWLTAALLDLQQQLFSLVRYQSIRRAALFARPLVFDHTRDHTSDVPNLTNPAPLDWHTDTLPLLIQYLQVLPKLSIDVYVPKSIEF